jgi:hypothetical protein
VFALALFAVLTLATSPSFAQAISGDVTGTVLDATGAGVPNATVTVENVATGVKATATTNQSGEYRVSNLLPGTYNVNVSAKGFTAASVKNLSVELNRAVSANVTLQVGSTSETVEVNAAAVQIDTTTAQVQNTFETKAAADLPTASIGAGVLNLSLLGSGVSSSGGVGAGTGPSVGGQRPRNNNFTVEGIDNNNKSVTGPLVGIPNDAVAEFTLLQNQFSPEYGHSSGGQFNSVVKSGTNQFHGTIYDYLQNRNLNAIDQSLQNQGFTKNPRYDNNRLGATFGGPIKRNKLFFFGNYEYNPQGFSGSQSAVVETPTAAGYSILAGLPGLSATNFGIYKQYVTASPTPDGNFLLQGDGKTPVTVGGAKIPLGVLPLASPAYTNGTAAVISIDYNISEKDQLRGRYIYNKTSGIDTAATFPAFYLALPTTFYVGTLTEYHNFTPNITNEFRLGYNRFNNTTPAGNFKFPGLDAFPNIVLNDTNVNIGPDGNAPQYTIQNLYQVTENLSWVKGRHTFKIGFDGRKYISPGTFTQRGRGEYNYNSTILFLQDFTPDNLSERSLGNVVYYGDQTSLYPYFNDTWRLKPNFTVNLGVRYEFTSVPYSQRLQALNHISDTPGVLVFNKPEPQYKNFAPRVGFAYSPGTSGKTSIRAGFGMAYDVLYDNIGILSLPPQLSSTVDTPLGSATGSGPNFLKNGGILPNASVGSLSRADAIASTSNYVPNQKLPYSLQWNLGIQHVFANNYTFEARYLGTRGVHLNVQQRVNIQPRVDANNFLPTYLTAPAQAQLDSLTTTLASLQARSNIVSQFRTAGFTNPIVEFSPIGDSSYHGLALQLDRRFSNGLQFKGAYTWSHLIDDSTADFFTTRLTPRRSENFQNLARDKASSALDRRHRFTFVALYDVPFMSHSSNWLARNVLGNWEIAPIYTFESPEYATVQSSTDSNLNGDSAGDRTIINTSGVAGTSSNVTALKNSAGATVAYLAVNPNARYIKAAAGALTNAGRNTLPTRRIDNVDLSLIKRFSYHERFKLELQAQMLNAFNHPQFIPGSVNQVTSIGTTGSGVLNFVTAGNKSFNNPEAAFSSNARVVQVAAKIVF